MHHEDRKMSANIQFMVERLKRDNRLTRFQCLVVNQDCSCLVVDRWRSSYYPSLLDLDRWLEQEQPTTEIDVPDSAPQPAANAS
jgi:hypothetical protein